MINVQLFWYLFKLSSKYVLKGSIGAKLKNKQYKKGSPHTTSKYDLYLNNVVHEIMKSPRRSSVAPLDDLVQSKRTF